MLLYHPGCRKSQMSYLSIVLALIAFATKNPELFSRLWAAITDAYQASLDMIDTFKAELPDMPLPREAEDTCSVEEMDAEERLGGLVSGSGTRAFTGQNFKKIVAFLQSGTGKMFLDFILSQIPK